MSQPLASGRIFDGYRLIRFLGRGGFGEVWLCQSEAVGDFRAFKWIPATGSDHLEKEYEALVLYRKAVSQIRSPHLVPIEHINRDQNGLYALMWVLPGLWAVTSWTMACTRALRLRRSLEKPLC